MKTHRNTFRRSLRFESLERRAMLSVNALSGIHVIVTNLLGPAAYGETVQGTHGFNSGTVPTSTPGTTNRQTPALAGIGATLNNLNNLEGPAAYGESIPRNNNLFLIATVQASTQGTTSPPTSQAATSGQLVNVGTTVANAASQLNVLGTDLQLVSGALGGAVLSGIQQDLQALTAGLNGASSGSVTGAISLPVDIVGVLAGVNASAPVQLGGIVQAIQGTLANLANDIQSLQGASSSPASDAVGGLGSTLQNVLQNVDTAISASGNGLGSRNGGLSGTGNLPITPCRICWARWSTTGPSSI